MTFFQWFIFFLIVQVVHFLGTWKLYKKAGYKPWEALIPIYNGLILLKIIRRPWWWIILLFVPVINVVMFPVIWVETIRSFGRHTTGETWLVVLTLGLYIYVLNYGMEVKYMEDRSLKPATAVGEWVSAILFAVVAASVVHAYFIQPFTIPTSSMEKSLLVGDFLFVSKFHYGARIPNTPAAVPMVHDSVPVLHLKSYFDWPQIPYLRLPGFEKVKRNDIVVFNWPVDTVPYFGYRGPGYIKKPIDKKTHYVKRAIGIPGDSLSIRDAEVYIDGKKLTFPDRARPETSYMVTTKGGGFNRRYLYENYDYTENLYRGPESNQVIFQSLTPKSVEKLRMNPNVVKIEPIIDPKGQREDVFPYRKDLDWNQDNYGPIYIPKKGATVQLNPENLSFYKRIIEVYDGEELGTKQKVSVRQGKVYINGELANTYTFKQDYYWMMGDNRHNSSDSRYFGFVPETHIVGKPVFIWLSIDHNAHGLVNKIRWSRMFTTVNGRGEPTSYLPHFLIVLVLIFGYTTIRKKRGKKKNK